MSKRIAIVNDEPDFTDMVSVLLQEEGYEVRSCGTGEEGLALLRDWRPALVLLDIRMEGLSGWDILRIMEADPQYAGIRVLVTSGAVEEVSAFEEELRGKGQDYVTLPFDLVQFLDKVRAMAGPPD